MAKLWNSKNRHTIHNPFKIFYWGKNQERTVYKIQGHTYIFIKAKM